MTTTNKLVRLEDVLTTINKWVGIKSGNHTTRITGSIEDNIRALPIYPEPTKGTNHALLQEYIDKLNTTDMVDAYSMLRAIQSRITEGAEYEIGKEYEFSDDGKNWNEMIFEGHSTGSCTWNHIRPIQVSHELTQAMEVMEKHGFSYSKK